MIVTEALAFGNTVIFQWFFSQKPQKYTGTSIF